MPEVLIQNIVLVEPILCSGGPPQPGDLARMYLNQEANPAFPEYIDGVFQFPLEQGAIVLNNCVQTTYIYSFIYDSEDLDGLNVVIQPYDILTFECLTCCTILHERVDQEIIDRTAAVATERSQRIAADTTLTNNLAAEVTARTNADTTLQNNINAEATTRGNADTVLTNNLATEVTNRTNADTTLTNNLAAEVTNRINGDNLKINKVIPAYASDGAADADTALLSGSIYYITGTRAVLRKP